MQGESEKLSQAKWMALWGAILLVCWLLRVGIAVRGGQDYWPDEFRYFQGADAARDLLDGGENARAKQVLFGTPEHAFFRWLSLPPGALEVWLGRSPVWVGAYWALFSVAVIGLVGVVARRAGAGRWEAGWAMGLAATATTLACYGRFLLPYDAALALVMAGLALGIRAESVGRMVGAGLAVGLGVLTYNGYWLAGGMVMLLVVLSRWQGGMGLVGRAVSGGVGLVAPGLAWWGTGRMLGYDTWAGLRSFSGSIIQGDFGLGYRVIGEYLWWTEGWWLAPVGVGIMAALVAVGRDRRWEREAWWVVAIAGIVGGLIFFSDVVEKFTVYGRLVRSLSPFLCLAAAAGFGVLRHRGWGGRRWDAVVAAGLVVVAAFNLAPVWRQQFPDQLRDQLRTEVARLQADGISVYRAAGVQRLWGVDVAKALPLHEVVWRTPHTMEYKPYRYEGYSAAQRAAFDAHDISMRLIRLTDVKMGGIGEGGYPGVLRLRAGLETGTYGVGQPVLSAGRGGRGSMFYMRQVAEDRWIVGFDNWGYGGPVSEPFELRAGGEVELVLFSGCQVPKADAYAEWRDRVVVWVDGRKVIDGRSPAHDVGAAEFFIGANLIGATTAGEAWAGELREVEFLSVAEAARWLE